MAVYSVYEPPQPATDRKDRAAQLVFVREGFSLGVAVLSPIWLAANRMWAGLAVYLSALTMLTAICSAAGVKPGWTAIAVLALHVIMGFEASAIERLRLEFQGWTDAGTASGRTRLDYERRFFDLWLSAGPTAAGETTGHAPHPTISGQPSRSGAAALGPG